MAKRRQRTARESGAGVSATTPSPTPKQGRKAKTAWKLMDRSTTMAAGAVAPIVAMGAWRAVTGRKPPIISDSPEVDVREAIGWAIVGGALVEVVKVGVRRQTAKYWVSSTGQLPPGMKSIKDPDLAEDLAEAKAEHTQKTRRSK